MLLDDLITKYSTLATKYVNIANDCTDNCQFCPAGLACSSKMIEYFQIADYLTKYREIKIQAKNKQSASSLNHSEKLPLSYLIAKEAEESANLVNVANHTQFSDNHDEQIAYQRELLNEANYHDQIVENLTILQSFLSPLPNNHKEVNHENIS